MHVVTSAVLREAPVIAEQFLTHSLEVVLKMKPELQLQVVLLKLVPFELAVPEQV